MLQVLLEISDKYSLSEMAQMAIEAGCAWLVLGKNIPDAEKREHYPALVELCRESGVMLTASDDSDGAKEYGMHGVFLSLGTTSPVKVREELGAEAVIGAEVAKSCVALELERADIDYVAISPDEKAATIISELRAAGSKLPVVAYVDRDDFETIAGVIAAGYSGVCCGKTLFEHCDPVENISALLDFVMKK